MFSLVLWKFWVFSFFFIVSGFHKGFLVEWYCLNQVWVVWFLLMCFKHSMDADDSCIFTWNFWLMNSVDWNKHFAFNPKNSKVKNLCWSLWLGNMLLELGSFAGSMMGSDILLFLCNFFWRSSLLEYWIQSYVLGHCFGCSLLLGTQLNSPWKSASSVLLLSLNNWVDVPGLMLIQLKPIPNTICHFTYGNKASLSQSQDHDLVKLSKSIVRITVLSK